MSRKRQHRRLRHEFLESRCVMDASPWHNVVQPADVNNDGGPSLADGSQLLSYLSFNCGEQLTAATPFGGFWYDVNNDFVVNWDDRDACVDLYPAGSV